MPIKTIRQLIDTIGLKTKVIVLLLVLSLIPLILVGAVTVNRANSWGKQSEESHFLQTSQFMASAYSDLFLTATRDLERLCLRFPAERLRIQSIRNELDAGLNARPSLEFWRDAPFQSMIGQVFSNFFLALPNGDVYFTAPYRNLSHPVKLSKFDWFESLGTTPTFLGTRLEALSGSKRPIILSIMPIINRQGRLVGYMGGQIDESRIEEIANRLQRNSLTESNLIAMSLATPDGTVLAHSTFANRDQRLPTYLLAQRTIGVSEVNVGSRPILVANSAVPPTNWSVRITAPKHHIYRVVHVLQRVLIVVTLLTFLLVIFISDYLARVVLRPVKALERGARMLESGSLGYRIELNRHTNDELGHLATAFNQMAASLEKKDEEIRTYGKNLETAYQEVDAMIYAITHDVRTALDDIETASQDLGDHYAAAPLALEKVVSISKKTAQISRLNRDLVKLIQTERESIEYAPFPSQRMFENLRSDIKARCKGDIFLSGELPELVGDEQRLSEAFAQIFENGLKFNRHPMPTVEVSTRREANAVVFEVSDNGVGLLPENFEKAFELFTRLDKQAEIDGSGTGLNLARRIFEDHGGSIHFARSNLGEGSTLVVKLPEAV